MFDIKHYNIYTNKPECFQGMFFMYYLSLDPVWPSIGDIQHIEII